MGTLPEANINRNDTLTETKTVVKLSDIPLTAIAKIVDYLEADEEGHYSGEPNHIVHSVRRLKKFLYANTPNQS
jgi:hypothetical protein